MCAVKSQLTPGLFPSFCSKFFLQISAGCCWAQSRMKVLLLAALVSQVVGRPQQADYQPGNVWSYTRPAQPTQWSTRSSVGSGAPTSSNSYHPFNSYNPYNSYDPYVLGGNSQPYQRPGDSVNSVSGSVGGPLVQDIGLNHQGSLPNMGVYWRSTNTKQC